MIGPKTDNSISDCDNNTQVGHNAGTITVGLTFEQHEAAMERAIARKEADLGRAHTAEKALIQRELDELRRRMLDLGADYQARLKELADTKAMLARYDNQIERTRFDQAIAALDNDDESLAVEILTELAQAKARRREDEAIEEAKIQFKLGEIAESRVEWASAAQHYTRAAELHPSYDNLLKAGVLLLHAGEYDAALEKNKKLVALSRHEYGPRDAQTTTALNNYAESLRAAGSYPEAEPLYREALEITRETLGDRHPYVAISLNNLAELLHATGRTEQAEPLCREALEIGRETLGGRHPAVAISLNNLALLLDATDRAGQATPLYLEALGIFRASLGDNHPDTKTIAGNTLRHLRQHAPDHPDLAQLQAVYGAAP